MALILLYGPLPPGCHQPWIADCVAFVKLDQALVLGPSYEKTGEGAAPPPSSDVCATPGLVAESSQFWMRFGVRKWAIKAAALVHFSGLK